MKSIKFQIVMLLLFIGIGIAAVSTNIIANMSTPISPNRDDFLVYFSRVGEGAIVNSNTSFSYFLEFDTVGTEVEIPFEITNASKNYDAGLSVSCNGTTEYVHITSVIDEYFIPAKTSTNGTIFITPIKSYVGDDPLVSELVCTLTVLPAEKESLSDDSVKDQLLVVGTEVSIGNELFNVISDDGTNVYMLAKYNINNVSPYKQSSTQNFVTFANSNAWMNDTSVLDLDVQSYEGNVKTLLNNYVMYLKDTYGINATANIITLRELNNLGCTVPVDYIANNGSWTCASSSHKDWLINGQYWWTRSVRPDARNNIWIMYNDGVLSTDTYNGVRPVIIVSKSDLN